MENKLRETTGALRLQLFFDCLTDLLDGEITCVQYKPITMFNRCFWTYTQLCFFTVAAFASSRFMKFSKRIGQRITSGATQIGHKRRPGNEVIKKAFLLRFVIVSLKVSYILTFERNFGKLKVSSVLNLNLSENYDKFS